VLLSLEAENVLLATWETDPVSVARVVPSGLEPAPVAGRYLVSIAALRFGRAHLGRVPLPPYSQLSVRTQVTWGGEPAAFLLTTRVSAFGLGGSLLGAPYRIARLRVRSGSVEAPALGLSLLYAVDGPPQEGPPAEHELALFEAGELRALRIRRGLADWLRAEPIAPPRADLLVAYGFELAGPPKLFYAEHASFATDLPPRPAE
jgi:hypothetical protein